MNFAKPFSNLVTELMRLPNVGSKTAQRLALHFLQVPKEEIEDLINALKDLKEKITYCSICFNLTDVNPCNICENNLRDKKLICVVEHPQDIIALEKTANYKGVYHCLQGVISPLNGITPEDLRIKELLSRLKDNAVQEVIIATNATTEGETTAMYLAKLIKPLNIKVTRIAYGLPVGSYLDYADEMTLSKAMNGRREL